MKFEFSAVYDKFMARVNNNPDEMLKAVEELFPKEKFIKTMSEIISKSIEKESERNIIWVKKSIEGDEKYKFIVEEITDTYIILYPSDEEEIQDNDLDGITVNYKFSLDLDGVSVLDAKMSVCQFSTTLN